MADSGGSPDDLNEQIDCEHIRDDVAITQDLSSFDDNNFNFDFDFDVTVPFSRSIDEIETMLMNDDDDDNLDLQNLPELPNNFLSDVLLDSSPVVSDPEPSGVVYDVSDDNKLIADGDDPKSKKRQRQLRNRDAAVRSRERRKMYVKDLEMKSRFFEGECKRLDMLLRFYLAENQVLRHSLHKTKPFGASMTKQESAVLFLESLLLGSLLWFMGIILWLQILPKWLPVHVTVERLLPLESKGSGNHRQRKATSNRICVEYFPTMMMMSRRRCRASKIRMKPPPTCLGF